MERIDLNCDLGESFGAYTIGMDSEVLPYITSANIACGFHGGDPLVMERTVAACARAGAGVGAHPGFPDLIGFGRRNMAATRMRSGRISPTRQGRFWPSAMNRACA